MSSVLPSPSIQLARSLANLPVSEVAGMSAFALFQRQLESGSTEAAVDAMKRLGVVAIMAGPEETVSSILPYLTNMVQQASLSDELLLILGQQLLQVMKVVSDPRTATDFLQLLERLATTEETVVRDQAVVVLNQLCLRCVDAIPSPTAAANANATDGAPTILEGVNAEAAATLIPVWMALVKRLAGADWFTAKVSCAGIIPSLLHVCAAASGDGSGASPAIQFELLTIYKELCADETPMVRRAAAKHLGMALWRAGWTHRDFAATQVTALAHDEQDSVRLLAVAALAQAGPSYGEHPTWTIQNWLPIVKDGSTDLSWRVRNNLGKNFSDVAYILGIHGDTRYSSEQNLVMACFVAMLLDSEAEVRAAAVGHLARMVTWGGPALFERHLQPHLPSLADDVVMEVRSKCALALMDAANSDTLDDAVILNSFGPILESLLQDEFHEVQLQVLNNLDKIARLLSGLPGVVTALLQMSKAANSRVREAVARLLPHLAEARGLDFFSTVLLEPAWLPLLLDTVASVRLSIVSCMALLARVAGHDFLLTTLLPLHISIYNQHSHTYLIRMTILHAHIETLTDCHSGPLFEEVITQILRGLVDNVPNVRTVAAKGLARIVADGDPDVVQTQIRPALEKCVQEETDTDCRQASQEALDQLN